MTEEEIKILQGLFQGANLNNAQINVVVQSGAKVVYKEVTSSTKEDKPQVSDEQMINAIEKHQSMFWAQSAWAVVFCVCRDHLGMADNMSEFERYIKGLPFTRQLSYECPDGTVQKALGNNPYMKMPIQKWKAKGGKERALMLAEKLIAELEEK